MELDIDAAASNYKHEGTREDLPREFQHDQRVVPHLSVPLLKLV